MTQFRTLGDLSGPDPFAPKPRTLTSEELLRVIALDPHDDMGHGGLRYFHRLVESRRGIGAPTREHELISWSMQIEPKRPEVRSSYTNPARLSDHSREPRQLTQGDLEFLRTIEGVAPGDVPVEDVRLLAELEATAESATERRLVGRVLNPIRRHHDRKEEEAALLNQIAENAPSVWRSQPVREAWLPVLAERLAEEARVRLEAELAEVSTDVREKVLGGVDADARTEANQRISDLWTNLEAETGSRANAARQRLSELASGAEPESSAPAPLNPDPGVEAARQRGREFADNHQRNVDALAGFRTIG